MAEIKIEKKKPVWPWILAVLIVAAILYFFVVEDNEMDTQIVDTTTEKITGEDTNDFESTRSTGEISAIREYIVYIEDPQMGLDHDYTNGALKRLIAAVEAKASNENVNINADLDQAKEKAEAITKDPHSLKHADMIKEAGQVITRAMKTLQTQRFANNEKEISDVETAVNNIKTNQPTLDQKNAVKNFFSKAGAALTSMR